MKRQNVSYWVPRLNVSGMLPAVTHNDTRSQSLETAAIRRLHVSHSIAKTGSSQTVIKMGSSLKQADSTHLVAQRLPHK